jgi:hypothetical protein
VNVKDKYSWTPLYRAAYNGHLEAVEALLELGADPSFKDEKGKTAAQMACTGGNKFNKDAIVRALEVRTHTPTYIVSWRWRAGTENPFLPSLCSSTEGPGQACSSQGGQECPRGQGGASLPSCWRLNVEHE